ncbi:arsinothricin resistance N-acetyltransferase ArsN1 family B [Herbaspirillum sp. alder98]|uniref:arsinothricin resistance N-acetyltransferase ArsN1 family B n=1 Tax=Herbaspirillum sp. alder98 TaxID=2913096 RepID=UPI001CD89006|nr:arsinothricin resistance N-acetyltransferase ArsN1 family B [Herbaspirillum sp. alder98]MCA1322966.1 GNAT family N-acetyltransferase [Herbaspirillum sp. alder98]
MSESIRAAQAADAAAICAIYNHYVETTAISFETETVAVDTMNARIAEVQSQFPWLVYEEEGVVLGYAYASKWKPRAAYASSVESSVYLHRDAGGRGIGKKLYQRLFAQLKAQGVHLVIGGIALPNAASVGLHESVGFIKCAHFSEVGRKFDRWVDVGYWQLNLEQVTS